MHSRRVIHVVGCHAGGEVGDVVVGGVAPPPGDTLWEQSRHLARDTRLKDFLLNEPRGGEPGNFEPYIQPQFKKWCTGRAFNVVENEPSEEEYPYRVAIEGTMDVTSSVVNRIPSAYASGTFVLKDLGTGETLFRYTLGTRAEGIEGNSEAALILTARNQGTAELLLEMATRLLAALPGKDSEFGRGE